MKWLYNQAYLLLIITAVTWSGISLIARATHETIPPIGLAFWRWALTFPIFLLIAWPYLRQQWPEVMKHWKIMLFLSLLSVTAYNTIIYFGLDQTTATNALLINTVRPVIIVFLSMLILQERINSLQALGFLLAIFGTGAIMVQGDPSILLTLEFNQGDILIVVATICWALYTVYLPKRPKINPAVFMTVTVGWGMAMLFPFYLYEAIFIEAVPVSMETVWSVGYLALISTVIAYLCYNRTVELVGANKAGLVSYIMPVVGTFLAWLLLDEQFEIYHAIGIALIVVGVLFATRSKKEG